MHFRKSKHFLYRSKNRSISEFVLNSLINYGYFRYSKNEIESVYFDKNSLSEIKNDDPDLYKIIEKYKNAYLIVKHNRILITAARAR